MSEQDKELMSALGRQRVPVGLEHESDEFRLNANFSRTASATSSRDKERGRRRERRRYQPRTGTDSALTSGASKVTEAALPSSARLEVPVDRKESSRRERREASAGRTSTSVDARLPMRPVVEPGAASDRPTHRPRGGTAMAPRSASAARREGGGARSVSQPGRRSNRGGDHSRSASRGRDRREDARASSGRDSAASGNSLGNLDAMSFPRESFDALGSVEINSTTVAPGEDEYWVEAVAGFRHGSERGVEFEPIQRPLSFKKESADDAISQIRQRLDAMKAPTSRAPPAANRHNGRYDALPTREQAGSDSD